MSNTNNLTPRRGPIQTKEIFTTEVMKKYAHETEQELMMVLGEGAHVTPDQQRSADEVRFSHAVLQQAEEELAEQDAGGGIMTHHHIRSNGHGVGPNGEVFSEQDIASMQEQHEHYGKDEFGLVIDGYEVDGQVAVQHAMIWNHEGELQEQTWDAGAGKVATIYEDSNGNQQTLYSDNIEQAEEKEAMVVAMKELEVDEKTGESWDNANIVQMQIAALKEMLMAA